MLNLYLLKILILVLFSGIIFYLYYFIFPGHNDFNFSELNFNGYNFLIDKNFIGILLFFLFFWSFYKIFSIFICNHKNDEKKIYFLEVIFLFFIFLFFTCFLYFISFFDIKTYNFENLKNSILLFFRIIYFLILPISIFFITTGFGKKIVNFLPNLDNFSGKIRFLLSLNLGFFSFVFILSIFSFFGAYNLEIIFFILGIFILFGYKEIFYLLKNLSKKYFLINKKEGGGINLLTTEFFGIIYFFLFSVGLISIIRPFPIGWDDLGVYMNYPKLLASSNGFSSFSEMYSWQIFTGIGYLFGNPTFAFFLNFSGYFFSFITLNLIFSEVFGNLQKGEKKSFLPLPIMLSTLFLGLPMSIFHSIKDMKLDQGIFFITVFTIFFTYKYLENIHKNRKNSLIFIFIIGILTGFVFSIKFTSLFLIISILSLLSFFFLGIVGFFGFLSIFFSIFLIGDLWKMMNVSIKFDIGIFIFSFLLGFFLLGIGIIRKKSLARKYFLNVFIFIFGVFLALFPWFSKNFIKTFPDISISGLLNGKPDKPEIDLTKIFSKEEIEQKNIEKQERRKLEIVTSNEDLKRYLGYESGILPYTNIFWNLTMQVNQGGKFTEISFIFFALIPLIFIFLPFFRNKNLYFIFIIFSFFQLLFFIKIDSNLGKNPDFKNLNLQIIEKIFTKRNSGEFVLSFDDRKKLEIKLEKENIPSKREILEIWDENRNFIGKIRDFLAYINLPFGYFIIFFIFFFPFFILNYFLKKTKETFIFRQNLAFSTVYIFLWVISSFSIAWYGIAVYFCLLLMILYGGFYISSYNEKNQEIKFYGSMVFLLTFLFFIIFTTLPHTVENFKTKAYLDYKTWKKGYLFETFNLHSDYDKIFFELNIDENKRKEFLNEKVNNPLVTISESELLREEDFSQVISELKIKAKNGDLGAKKTLEKIYSGILYPEEKYQNQGKIFRIGTFLKYYISENQKRVFEDGLLYYFNDYLYDKNPEKTWENLKGLGFKYLLVDLGAATIDDSEKHFLTIRYEKFLKNLRAKNLEIIETDSVCLRFATDNENIRKNEEKFFEITNGTYESYDEKDNMILRTEKRKKCISEIEKYVNSSDFERKKFPYLKKYIGKNFDEISKDFPKAKFVIYKIK